MVPQKLLTDTELEMMTALWEIHEGSVHDVLAALPKARKLAYTSVSTMLRIMEQKGFLKTRKEGRGHVYIPAVAKRDYEARSVDHLVESVFQGERVGMIRQLLDSKRISDGELAEIRRLLAERKP